MLDKVKCLFRRAVRHEEDDFFGSILWIVDAIGQAGFFVILVMAYNSVTHLPVFSGLAGAMIASVLLAVWRPFIHEIVGFHFLLPKPQLLLLPTLANFASSSSVAFVMLVSASLICLLNLTPLGKYLACHLPLEIVCGVLVGVGIQCLILVVPSALINYHSAFIFIVFLLLFFCLFKARSLPCFLGLMTAALYLVLVPASSSSPSSVPSSSASFEFSWPMVPDNAFRCASMIGNFFVLLAVDAFVAGLSQQEEDETRIPYRGGEEQQEEGRRKQEGEEIKQRRVWVTSIINMATAVFVPLPLSVAADVKKRNNGVFQLIAIPCLIGVCEKMNIFQSLPLAILLAVIAWFALVMIYEGGEACWNKQKATRSVLEEAEFGVHGCQLFLVLYVVGSVVFIGPWFAVLTGIIIQRSCSSCWTTLVGISQRELRERREQDTDLHLHIHNKLPVPVPLAPTPPTGLHDSPLTKENKTTAEEEHQDYHTFPHSC